MKSTILLLIVLVASTLAMPAPEEEHREYSRSKRSFLGGYGLYPPYGGYGYGFPAYGFAYPGYGYPYGIGGYGLYKGFGHGFYG
ncbi:shematrin-like protein 1 [Ischnura elegans]|uniref:shematrin-like protein 1 n=1 Tax=Ischnura elegans TaxID=197161 RepID=UPI001ED8B666|nr:shematrin-like protein 1 [Ischnura elegans]